MKMFIFILPVYIPICLQLKITVIELSLLDFSKINSKLYWKLFKNVYNVKSSSEIPALQLLDENGKHSILYSNKEKVETLNTYIFFMY